MSVFETVTETPHGTELTQASYETSPFAAAQLSGPVATEAESYGAMTGPVVTPFAEAMASYDESQLQEAAYEALTAEFEDEDFAEALQALADEAAGRQLTAVGSWGQQEQAMRLSSDEAEQWMQSVAARSDQLLAELETHFGERPVQSLAPGEIEAVAGLAVPGQEQLGPLDAQELFLGKLVSKVVKVAKGVGKLVGKLFPIGKLLGFLRKLIRPLLQRVLQRAIGKLPPDQRPLAEKLRGRFGGQRGTAKPAKPDQPDSPAPDAAPATGSEPAAADPAAAPAATGEAWSSEALAGDFDARLAEILLAPHDSAAEGLAAEFEAEVSQTASATAGPYAALDTGRQRLAEQLLQAEPGRAPTAELEEFIPVVMAAMKLIKLGVRVIGRKRVVGFIAKLLATLIQGMVGEQAARTLSHHIADAGLRLLGLEAEGAQQRTDGLLGAEALVAATEDTIREVLSQPAESLQNELLLESAVQEAFTAAAVRHFPAEVLRPDLTEAEDGERGIWIMFPRAARPHYRYKKYTVVAPLRLSRATARMVILADGETLEDRLLDAGARNWPVAAEAHHYELLPGGELGHLAAYEISGETPYAEGALEFQQLQPNRPHPIANPAQHDRGAPGAANNRVVRLVVPGLAVRRRSPFTVRLDLSGPKPHLRLHIHVSERVAHELVEHLAKHRMVQVVAVVGRLVGGPVRPLLAQRLVRKLGKHGIELPEGRGRRLADDLADAMNQAVAKHLPATTAALTAAAKDPAAGITLTFAFPFADRKALTHGKPGDPVLSIRAGAHRD